AYVNPSGRVMGFEHVIPEAAAGARPNRTEARQRAEECLRRQTQAPHRLIEEELRERPNRYDYVFTWEEEGFRAKDATLRRTVELHGDRVGRYSEYLYVPEQWKRDFAALRSKNELYAQIAQAFYLPLVLGAIVILIRAFRRGLIRWRPLLLISLTVAGLMIINQWNSLPFFLDGAPTSVPYSQSVLYGLLVALGAGVGVFFYVILAAAAGEPLYRESQLGHLSLLAVPGRRAIRTREFFVATVVGYGFAAAHIAFVVAFYLIGRRFGVWSPQDINYSDFLSTKLPWIYPLTISLLASTSEEFWFRLLAIPLLKRWLRSTWLAVVIPAFVWGFLHATYPQQPGYIRGLEVGVIGVAAGFLMLRFGILATLIWHYTVDAILIGMFLIRAESWYFQLSGWLVGGAVLLPLIVSLVFYLRHGGFLVDPALQNSSLATEEPRTTAAPAVEHRSTGEPLAPRWQAKWLYGIAGVALVIGAAARSRDFGDFIEVQLSRIEAQVRSDAALRAHGRDPGQWRRVTEFFDNLWVADFEYIRRLEGKARANEVVRERTTAGVWTTRYFRPLEKEEWRVSIDSAGRLVTMDHVLDEKAPGANLTSSEARTIAERYLAGEGGVPVNRYRLADSQSEKKDKRTDHSFVWEDPNFRLGEAKARVSVDVLGDEPSGVRRFLKLPEEWLREFQRPRLAAIALPGVLGAAALLLLIAFVRRLSSRGSEQDSAHRYHWRVYLAAGAAAAGFAFLSAINRIPGLLAGYDTARPLQSHLAEAILSRTMLVVLVGFGAFLAALAADVFLQAAAGDRRLPHPSVMRALAVLSVAWCYIRGLSVMEEHLPGPHLTLPLWSLPAPETFAP
ncbi:MAG TPA: type II CAAX endopeptidase family protein, partial [Bryobacteraceae bacterium]|nr:type II CAAX endopeptidase family protein [Bryobacteraceae bacterium]